MPTSKQPSATSGEPSVRRDEEVTNLLLDDENPRLASLLSDTAQQDEIVKTLWSEMSTDEVAYSIAANGFYRYEPLLVIPAPKSKGKDKFIVVEGNRRLAAVRLLREPALRTKVRATELPELTADAIRKLSTLPVAVYPNRESLWAYLGFRHINGTKPWDAFSKAKYVAQVHEEFGVALDQIANRIGDRHSTVQRLYNGYKVLRQAERAGFDKEDRARNRFYFSHLYTAVDQPEFRKFLGVDSDKIEKAEPVPQGKKAELLQLMAWLYGRKSQNIEPVVRKQSPDLNTLRMVVSTKQGLSALRAGYSLERAHQVAIGDAQRFRDSLTLAKQELQAAKGTVATGFSGEKDLLGIAEDISTTARSVLDEMKAKASRS